MTCFILVNSVDDLKAESMNIATKFIIANKMTVAKVKEFIQDSS